MGLISFKTYHFKTETTFRHVHGASEDDVDEDDEDDDDDMMLEPEDIDLLDKKVRLRECF